MAKVVEDLNFRRSGTFAGVLLFQTWKGITYARMKPKYVYKNTPRLQHIRGTFARAVKTWQGLDIMTQYLWRALAYGKEMSGYEYYIKKFMEDRL